MGVANKVLSPVFVTYARVSTVRQGASGLGLEGQQAALALHLASVTGARVAAEFVEIESGANNERPKLSAAIAACKLYGATLLIAKLDRLSRDAHFLLGLEKAGIDFVCADMPSANRLTVGIMAMVAEEERRMISKRTSAALAAAKARGVRLGGNRGKLAQIVGKGVAASVATRKANADEHAARVAPFIIELLEQKLSLHRIAAELTARGVKTPRGGIWTATSVRRIGARTSALREIVKSP